MQEHVPDFEEGDYKSELAVYVMEEQGGLALLFGLSSIPEGQLDVVFEFLTRKEVNWVKGNIGAELTLARGDFSEIEITPYASLSSVLLQCADDVDLAWAALAADGMNNYAVKLGTEDSWHLAVQQLLEATVEHHKSSSLYNLVVAGIYAGQYDVAAQHVRLAAATDLNIFATRLEMLDDELDSQPHLYNLDAMD